jgi:hypothetical protein
MEPENFPFPCGEHTELQKSLLICLMNSDNVFRIWTSQDGSRNSPHVAVLWRSQ